MRIAIISDVHGNYPALVNVIEDARKINADKFIFLGDYIFDLPFSNEIADLLMGMDDAHIIKGNKESYLDSFAKEDQSSWTSDQLGQLYQTYRELKPEAFNFLTGLSETEYIRISPSVVIHAAHYLKSIIPLTKTLARSMFYLTKMLETPFSHEQYLEEFTAIINTEGCAEEIKSIGADVILTAHNHLQGYGYCGDKLVINPGSCGQPLDFNNDAAYTILDVNEKAETPGEIAIGKADRGYTLSASSFTRGLKVVERRVTYDTEFVIKSLKRSTLYTKGKIWCELVIIALRTGRDYFGRMFENAARIAKAKGETGSPYGNETWKEAFETLKEIGEIV